jgi:hypothetical protein
MRIQPAEALPPPPPPVSASGPSASSAAAKGDGEPSAFSRVLKRLEGEIDRGEAVVDKASRGGSASADPAALLALQAGVYRYVEAVDLATKLIDRATNGVKTVLQGQLAGPRRPPHPRRPIRRPPQVPRSRRHVVETPLAIGA